MANETIGGDDPEVLDRYIDVCAQAVGLDIPLLYRADVQKYLAISFRMARIVEQVPLDIEDDMAPVFRA